MPPLTSDVSLTDDLRVAFSRIARRLRQATDDGLTSSQMSALNVIAGRGPLRLSELAAIERVAAPTITKIIEILVNSGWVQRADDPIDRRASLVQLTPEGHKKMKRVRLARNRALEQLLGQLTPSDRMALEAAIPAIVALSLTSQ
jgi:DNA-binding MarR family transcriptional regulator